MARYDKIRDDALRAKLEQAHKHLRSAEATEAVRLLSDTFLAMMSDKPELLTAPAKGARMQMPLWMRWPRLGANLVPESVEANDPKIEFTRERFAMSEAITYFEFTVDTAIEQDL